MPTTSSHSLTHSLCCVVLSLSAHPTQNEVSFDRPPPEEWSREVELLGRGFCPNNVWETARLRVALAENRAVAAEMAAAAGAADLTSDPQQLALAKLRVKVTDALERGGSMQW
jgi:hypothetical protein